MLGCGTTVAGVCGQAGGHRAESTEYRAEGIGCLCEAETISAARHCPARPSLAVLLRCSSPIGHAATTITPLRTCPRPSLHPERGGRGEEESQRHQGVRADVPPSSFSMARGGSRREKEKERKGKRDRTQRVKKKKQRTNQLDCKSN